jgi:Fur family ferric uptake transcriptional regulator
LSTVDEILGVLRESGGRVTTARRATVETLLANADHHVSAEEIVAQVRARHSDVAESTVYRTLATLEDLGIITHMHLGHGPATFHLSDRAHRHLVCQNCHGIIETPADLYADLTAELERRYGFQARDEHFAISGVCRSCLRQEKLRRRAGGSPPSPAGRP